MAIYSPIMVARFWSKVDVRPSDLECWPWTASVNQHGYGRFKERGTAQNASRIAWQIANDQRLLDWVARHTCDNPICCNPAHIISGTQRDNVLDAKARGRGRNFSAKGAENPRAKLSDQDVAEIRRRIAAGDGDRAIAADFPVTAAMIWRIRRGKSWT